MVKCTTTATGRGHTMVRGRPQCNAICATIIKVIAELCLHPHHAWLYNQLSEMKSSKN